MMRLTIFFLLSVFLFSACIKDDFIEDTVDPVLRITTTVDTISINSDFQFEALYLDNVGQAATPPLRWQSSQPDVISIDEASGLAQALQLGSSIISVELEDGSVELLDEREVSVGQMTVTSSEEKAGMIGTTSSYALTGDFTMRQDGNNLVLEFANNYVASSALPGLYLYLSNNKNSVANALEVAAVQVFSGAHSYTIPNVNINNYSYLVYYCKPFSVKVGDGEIL